MVLSELGLGGKEPFPEGLAQVGEIKPPEDPVPVGVVTLGREDIHPGLRVEFLTGKLTYLIHPFVEVV